jgi:hypothetical protein
VIDQFDVWWFIVARVAGQITFYVNHLIRLINFIHKKKNLFIKKSKILHESLSKK